MREAIVVGIDGCVSVVELERIEGVLLACCGVVWCGVVAVL